MPISYWVTCLFIIELYELFILSVFKSFITYMCCEYFSQYVAYLFIFLVVCFDKKKWLIVIKSNIISFVFFCPEKSLPNTIIKVIF